MFDRFWGLMQEARVVLTPHDGADGTYAGLGKFLSDAWGDEHLGDLRRGNTSHMGQMGTFSGPAQEPDHPRLRLRHHRSRPLRAVPEAAGGVHRVRLRLGTSLLEALEYLGHGGSFHE